MPQLASPTNDPLRPLEHIAFTVPFNMSEQPAASINCGSRPGLPIGLQIAGPRFDDLGVLQVARAFEQLRAPLPPWPSAPAALQRDMAQAAPQTTAIAADPIPVPAAV
jgi:Asp-tRNA(Asn)/Glu-tRNA(Gln) amidotransferase A subunit family amidase